MKLIYLLLQIRSSQPMHIFSNLEIVKNLAAKIIEPRHDPYPENSLKVFLMDNPYIIQNKIFIKTENMEILAGSLFSRQSESDINKPSTCIIYLHGLGSNRLQVLPILKFFKNLPYDICAFDSIGSGYSTGAFTTYGLNESKDLHYIISSQQLKKYEQIILWGRSMGSVASILYNSKYKNPRVNCMILDSPFCSFNSILIDIGSSTLKLPKFIIESLIEPLKQCFKQNYEFDPFSINVEQKISKLTCKLCFIYSKNDDIVDYTHSETLIKNCRNKPKVIQILEGHRVPRNDTIFNQILKFIEFSFTRKRSLTKSIVFNVKNAAELREAFDPNKILKLIEGYSKTTVLSNQTIQFAGKKSMDIPKSKLKGSGILNSVIMERKSKQNKKISLQEIWKLQQK